MINISQPDIEFLVFFGGELEEIEAALNRPVDEANFRVLAARTRALLHSSESALVRAFDILNLPLQIRTIKDVFLLMEQSETSPAVYTVNFLKN